MGKQIILLGLSHKTAPVEIRERVASICADGRTPLEWLPQLKKIDELFFLSTCNRVEFLFTADSAQEGIEELSNKISTEIGQPLSTIQGHIYVYYNLEAVKHIFKVASSLDSMVVGEPQILGQIKDAYRESVDHRTSSVILNRLLHKSFSVAKRIRTETKIGSYAVSISYAAVELAKKIFGSLENKAVLLIGAGEMAELAAEHLIHNGVSKIYVVNRTLERAVELATRFRGSTIPFDQIPENLSKVDIIISSTGASGFILEYDEIKSRMRARRNRPLFFIDIAVPRDIEPTVGDIDNVYLYDIDSLQGLVELNLNERRKEAEQAEHIIEEEALKFDNWLKTLEVVPTIVALREKAEKIRQQELRKSLLQLSNNAQNIEECLEVLTKSIINKLLHDPILFLKRKSIRDSKNLYVDLVQSLFNLHEIQESERATGETSKDNVREFKRKVCK
ncbi:MAG: glutamyl-tRNA reductase [Deltaproteobacteria bacterium]|nr:MAG: glutamyl-tRNA reductase [Deltaproteobacteria bacterium]